MSTDPTAPVWLLANNVAANVTSSITDNLSVLLPVGIGIMAILIGIALIPRIVYKFF